MTPYYDDGQIQIWHGDCREILPLLEPADLVLTDPPYNVGMKYESHDDKMPDDEYAAWCGDWFSSCRSLAKRVIIFPGHGNLPVWWGIEKPSGVGCWYKPGNPAGGGVFQWCEWEPWLMYGQRIGGSDVIRATVNKQRDVGGHPCPKPLSLFKTLLERTKAQSVLDPFLGSGTTMRAAKDLGIRGVAIEIEERYCEIAAKRLQQSVMVLA
jgi:DNA modification methylase